MIPAPSPRIRRHFTRTAVACAAWLALAPAPGVWADADGAKGYLKEAEEKIENRDFDAAGAKLELAETELDGVDAGAKAPIVAGINAAKAKIAEAQSAANKPKYTRMLRNVMDDAESAIGNLVTWPGAANRFQELAADPVAKATLGAELDAAAKKFATFRKLHGKKAAVALAGQLEDEVKRVEDQWKEAKPEITDKDASPNSKASAIEKTQRYLDDARKRLKDLPEDDEHAKALGARLTAVGDEFTRLALADRIQEVLVTLKRQYETYQDDWSGFEQETTGPTWVAYRAETSEKMGAFLAPKTRVYISRIADYLEGLAKEEDYESVKSDPGVKAYVDGIAAKHAAAYQKMLGFVTPVVEAALKAKVDDEGPFSNLRDNVRLALGEKSPEGLALQARLTKKLEAHTAATTGAVEAKVKLVATLYEQANTAWPALKEGLKAQDDADLSNPGKLKGRTIRFTSDNLMGWRFKPGDFYFATTLSGFPVAGRMDPQLLKQIKATEAAIGRGLGDDDNDGKWEVFAVVTERKARLMARKQVEAKGKIDDVDITLKGEYAEPVDAVVIDIIAAKCGPFAGAKDRGVLKEDGTIAK